MSRARDIANLGAQAGSGLDASDITTGVLPVGVTGGTGLAGVPGTINEVDKWRIHTASTTSTGATILTSNFERSHTYGAFDPTANGMTGMSESSGVFTFPSTGVWLIIINAMFEMPSGTASDRRLSIDCWSTTDSGSNYYMLCQSPTSLTNDGFPNVYYGLWPRL